MTPAAESLAMSHKLTPARQNEMLSRYPWTPEGRVRVTCTHRTAELLRYAGVRSPRALESYDLSVRRDRSGFLVIDHETDRHGPQAAGETDPLFAPGGLLYDPDAPLPPAEAAAECERFIREFQATRLFEVIAGARKLRISICAYDAETGPDRADDTELAAVAAALASARRIVEFEIGSPQPAA